MEPFDYPKVITPYGQLAIFYYRELESDEDQPVDAVARFGGRLMLPDGHKDTPVWASIRVKRIGNRWQTGGAVEGGSVVDYTPTGEVGFMIYNDKPITIPDFASPLPKDVLQAVAAALSATHTAINHVLSEPDGVSWRLSLQRQREELFRQADSTGARAGDKPRSLNF